LTLPDETAIGAVDLIVRDLDRSVEFYAQTIGFSELGGGGGTAELGAGGNVLLRLRGEPEAPPRPPRTTGLFHFAILVSSRAELGRTLIRLAERGWRLTGASDHLVSEALYLNDPDGIGIEIYHDRPRDEWPRAGETLQMATLPLDLDDIAAEHDPAAALDPPIADGTVIGHVHLNVADLRSSEDFWCGEIGFDVTVRTYPGALFVSAGGYHHHLGLNTWNGTGVPSPPEGAIGLERFEVVAPGAAAREATDPSGIRVRLIAG
jgi:catechol 2,3-dioxygenase